MRAYQTVVILKPDSEEAEIDRVNDKVANYVSQDGGSILRADKWGKKRLAYKIKKNRFGIYLNIFHTYNIHPFSLNLINFKTKSGLCKENISAHNTAALIAPALPIDTVATGTPFGILTVANNESKPSIIPPGRGIPITGNVE